MKERSTINERSAIKERLDKMLVARGLADSREKAQALILAGAVRVEGLSPPKAGSRVGAETVITVSTPDHPFVGRGGVKLEAALKHFNLDPSGWTCMDIGASTGGFTHCLVLRGARRVYAVDVGYGQLAWEMRNHPAVVVLERTNIRHLATDAVPENMDLVVVDVSFIALSTVLAHAVRFLAPGGRVVGLVKPQFEAGREQVGRGGLVRDESVHQDVLEKVRAAGAALGLKATGQLVSPIAGKKSGNREFLILWEDARPRAANAEPGATPVDPPGEASAHGPSTRTP